MRDRERQGKPRKRGWKLSQGQRENKKDNNVKRRKREREKRREEPTYRMNILNPTLSHSLEDGGKVEENYSGTGKRTEMKIELMHEAGANLGSTLKARAQFQACGYLEHRLGQFGPNFC